MFITRCAIVVFVAFSSLDPNSFGIKKRSDSPVNAIQIFRIVCEQFSRTPYVVVSTAVNVRGEVNGAAVRTLSLSLSLPSSAGRPHSYGSRRDRNRLRDRVARRAHAFRSQQTGDSAYEFSAGSFPPASCSSIFAYLSYTRANVNAHGSETVL